VHRSEVLLKVTKHKCVCLSSCSFCTHIFHDCSYRGSLELSRVELRGLGQPNTARPILAVRHNVAGTSLHSCTFFNNSGPGISFESASTGSVTSSVVAGTDGPSIAVWNDEKHSSQGYSPPDRSNFTFIDNVGAWARSLGVSVVMDQVANFVLCPKSEGCSTIAYGNVAAGSANYGFVLRCASHATVIS
jgi:hypothetical protein